MTALAACPGCVGAPAEAATATAAEAQQFAVPTIHCAACIGKIERRLQSLAGVGEARVNLSLKRLSVTGPVPQSAVVQAVEGLGFEIHPLDRAVLARDTDPEGRALLLRLAVAGFAMMNVMLLSVAVWSGAEGATRDLFHLISAGIALPVVAFSAQPFFRSALGALQYRRLNMDVPIALAILLAAGMSLYEALHGGRHAYFDAALSLTFFLLIGRYLDHRMRMGARSAARELAAMEVEAVQRLDAKGATREVPLAQVAAGDRLMIAAGARVPVDGVLESGEASLDRAALTGESLAVTRAQGAALQAGEVNLGRPFILRATAPAADSTLRRMAALVETAENGRNGYTALADRAAQVYAPAVHLLALVAFLGWVVATGDARFALNVAIAVLIITCPCALGLAVPAVSTAAIGRLFSEGFLVKHATALERLAEVDHAVFDKTGTLTQASVAFPETAPAAARGVALALAQASTHPLSVAVARSLEGETPAPLTEIEEIPGLGVSARWRGEDVRLGQGAWLGADFDGLGLKIGAASAIALPTGEVLRPGAEEALAGLDLPYEVLTGDAEGPAARLAARLDAPVLSGLTPEQKLAHLDALRAEGRRVLMLGDGLNDTAALAGAHASLAPARAVEASRSAADIVILKDTLASLPLVLRIARATVKLSRQNFTIAGLYNLVAVPIALAGHATPLMAALAMSISSITVLANAQRIRSVR